MSFGGGKDTSIAMALRTDPANGFQTHFVKPIGPLERLVAVAALRSVFSISVCPAWAARKWRVNYEGSPAARIRR
jgi:hypothetical protein